MSAASKFDNLKPEAFKKLFPEEYFSKFISKDLRPDGRPLGRSRPLTIAINAVSTADSSALVKIGSSTALAGVKLEVTVPSDAASDHGQVPISVEMAALASADARPGRPSELAQCLAEQASGLLTSSGLDLTQLCILKGKAAWVAYMDVYILDADGSLLDAVLLACVAALSALQLPAVTVTEAGNVVPAEGAKATNPARPFKLSSTPLALTCGEYGGKLVVDPDAWEEALCAALTTVTVDASGRLIGLWKAGGKAVLPDARLLDCIEAAKLRYREAATQLQRALESATVPME